MRGCEVVLDEISWDPVYSTMAQTVHVKQAKRASLCACVWFTLGVRRPGHASTAPEGTGGKRMRGEGVLGVLSVWGGCAAPWACQRAS